MAGEWKAAEQQKKKEADQAATALKKAEAERKKLEMELAKKRAAAEKVEP